MNITLKHFCKDASSQTTIFSRSFALLYFFTGPSPVFSLFPRFYYITKGTNIDPYIRYNTLNEAAKTVYPSKLS